MNTSKFWGDGFWEFLTIFADRAISKSLDVYIFPTSKLSILLILNSFEHIILQKMIPHSELILNSDGTIFHLHLKPEDIARQIILVGDQQRVDTIGSYFDEIEFSVQNREFKTITGTYNKKRITVISTGIGTDNIDIVMNELDALGQY